MYLQTYTGKKFDFFDVRPEMICFADIAWHLSHLNRYAGATVEPYSVGEHSWNVWRCVAEMGGTPRQQRAALGHDFPETYTVDLTSPFKAWLAVRAPGAIKEIENTIYAAGAYIFDVDPEDFHDPLIKLADTNLVLAAEAEALLRSVPGEDWAPKGFWGEHGRKPWSGFVPHCWSPYRAQKEFTFAAEQLGIDVTR